MPNMDEATREALNMMLAHYENGDLVDVVRCKDCRFYDPEWKLCQHQRTGRAPDWYCASGRTKE